MQARTLLLLIGLASVLVGVRATIFLDLLKHEDADKKSVKTMAMLLAGGEPLDPEQAKQCQGNVLSVIPDTSAPESASCFIGCLPTGRGRAACCPTRTVFVPPTLSDPLGDCVPAGLGCAPSPLHFQLQWGPLPLHLPSIPAAVTIKPLLLTPSNPQSRPR